MTQVNSLADLEVIGVTAYWPANHPYNPTDRSIPFIMGRKRSAPRIYKSVKTHQNFIRRYYGTDPIYQQIEYRTIYGTRM